MTSTRRSGQTRRSAVAAAAVLALGGLAACGEDGGEAEVTAEDLQGIEEQVGLLEERITTLEDEDIGITGDAGLAGDEPQPDEGTLFEDPATFVGEEVTVSGQVTELYDTTDAGAAFQIIGETGDPIPVVSTDPPEELLANDTVRVTGTVVQAEEATFEQDFGIAADELLDNVEGFWVDAEGEPVIAAESVEVVQGG